MKYTEDAARALGVRVLPLEVRAPAHYDSVFAPLAAKPVGGLVMFTNPLTWANWKRVADFAFANRLPTVCEFRQLAESRCLASYGPTFDEFDRRVASQVDRIPHGADQDIYLVLDDFGGRMVACGIDNDTLAFRPLCRTVPAR